MLNFFKRIRSVWFPDEFHGWGLQSRYFEGWYYKLVSADEQYALAVIPGISMNEAGQKQAFVQVMDGKACTAAYHAFPGEMFQPGSGRFELQIDRQYFSARRMVLDLPGLSGEIRFMDLQPWPKMLGAPGIMGWYSFVPFMECNHGVLSLHHELEGTLLHQGKEIRFDGGKGYMEKDWGRSFPRAYVWMQCNHFDAHDRVSLMASVAHIPWLNGHFIGFIAGFWIDGKLIRFATYNGASKRLRFEDHTVELSFRNRQYALHIKASQAAGTPLLSPISGEMTGKVQESLLATMEVVLYEHGRCIFKGNGRNAGLEVAGDVDCLTDK